MLLVDLITLSIPLHLIPQPLRLVAHQSQLNVLMIRTSISIVRGYLPLIIPVFVRGHLHQRSEQLPLKSPIANIGKSRNVFHTAIIRAMTDLVDQHQTAKAAFLKVWEHGVHSLVGRKIELVLVKQHASDRVHGGVLEVHVVHILSEGMGFHERPSVHSIVVVAIELELAAIEPMDVCCYCLGTVAELNVLGR